MVLLVVGVVLLVRGGRVGGGGEWWCWLGGGEWGSEWGMGHGLSVNTRGDVGSGGSRGAGCQGMGSGEGGAAL